MSEHHRQVKASRQILVTGGAGFLGSFLCERLLKRGDTVLCVDNYYTGSKTMLRICWRIHVSS